MTRGSAIAIAAILAACGGASPGPVAPPAISVDPEAVRELELTAQPAIVREVRATPDELGGALTAAIFALVTDAQAQGLDPAGPPFARYLSRGNASDPRFVVEAGLPVVKPPVTGSDALPAGPAATIVFVGPHADVGRAHAALDAWLAAHHRRASGPRWEVYLTNPIATPDPAEQRTAVFVPLAPAEAPR